MSLDEQFTKIGEVLQQVAQTHAATHVAVTFSFGDRSMTGGELELEWPAAPDDPYDRDEARGEISDGIGRPWLQLMRSRELVGKTVHAWTAVGEPLRVVWFPSTDDSDWIGDLRISGAFKKTKVPPAEPLTQRVADNDLSEIRRLLAARGHTEGFSEEEIAKAEKSRKVTFPPELREFFRHVRKGEILGDGTARKRYAEVVAGLKGGTGKYGNVVDPWKRTLRPNSPLPVMPEPTASDVVQPLYADRGWVVFADDGGGNAYALDLVPGPKGRVGQVVQFDHELDDPPQLVAHSLTDFLAGKSARAKRHAQVRPRQKVAFINVYRDKEEFEPGELDDATRVYIGPLTQDFDFERLRGLDGVQELEIARRDHEPLDDVSALKTLVSVTKLIAPGEVWAAIVQQDAWPPSLREASLSNGSRGFAVDLQAAQDVLAHYGRPPLETHAWEG